MRLEPKSIFFEKNGRAGFLVTIITTGKTFLACKLLASDISLAGKGDFGS